MFIAGIEIFFGVIAGALLLWLAVVSFFAVPHFAKKPIRWFAARNTRDWAFMALIVIAIVGLCIR